MKIGWFCIGIEVQFCDFWVGVYWWWYQYIGGIFDWCIVRLIEYIDVYICIVLMFLIYFVWCG